MRFIIVTSLAVASVSTPALAYQTSCSAFELPGGLGVASYDPFIIFFDWGSDAINPQSADILENVARAYAGLGHCLITITGHADRSGSEAYNMILSRRRAQSVGEYLRHLGITAEFRYEPFGETRALVETPDGQPEIQNRRSEILVGARQP